MVRRSLPGAAVFAASLLVLFIPAAANAQATPSSRTHTTPESLSAVVARGEKECIQPPKSFDLKTLSDAQLALYGLPTHRVLDGAPLFWSGMLAHYKHRGCGADIPMTSPGPDQKVTPTRPARTETPAVSGAPSLNWAGNYATGVPGTYREAQVTFTVPSVSGHMGSTVYFWAGVGGAGNTSPSEVLVQDGVEVIQCPTGISGPQCITERDNGTLPSSGSTWRYNPPFYEIVNSNEALCTAALAKCNPVIMTGIPVYPGDSMTAYVESNFENSGYDYFEVCNNTHSTCTSAPINTNSSSFSDSAAGECIGEEPFARSVPTYDANFGTVGMDGCLITNSSNTTKGVGAWPHNYSWMLDANGKTLVTVGSIVNNQNYALGYCTTATTTGNSCG
jgi:hypothetical protein